MLKIMDTTCQCVETLNSKGERLVPKHHNCAYTKKRTALVWPASILAERDCEMFLNGNTDPEESAIAFNRTFTASMDKLAKESGLL
jgi:hypothetical protein